MPVTVAVGSAGAVAGHSWSGLDLDCWLVGGSPVAAVAVWGTFVVGHSGWGGCWVVVAFVAAQGVVWCELAQRGIVRAGVLVHRSVPLGVALLGAVACAVVRTGLAVSVVLLRVLVPGARCVGVVVGVRVAPAGWAVCVTAWCFGWYSLGVALV